jgi:hypothetical protein
MGALELLVFDPLLLGPKSLGPVPLQLWRRDVTGAFERVHAGDAPVYSSVLEAWFAVDGRKLVIADDRAGTRPWPTLEEQATEQSKAEAERERAMRLELEAKLRRLEAGR